MAGRAERMRTTGLCVLLLLCLCFVSRGLSSPFSADRGLVRRAAEETEGVDKESPILNQKRQAESDQGLSNGQAAATIDDQWPDGVVPYDIFDGDFSSEEEQEIEESIAEYERLTCLRFLRATPAQRARLRYWEDKACWSWGQNRCIFMFAKNNSNENNTNQDNTNQDNSNQNNTFGSGRPGLSYNNVKTLNLMYKCSEKCPQKPVCARSCFVDKNCTCVCREDMENDTCVNRAGEEMCADLVQQGQCEQNPAQMLRQCQQACGLCQVTPTPMTRVSGMGRSGILPPVARPAIRPTAPVARPAMRPTAAPVARRPAVRPTAAQVARRPAVRPTAAQVARRPAVRPTAAQVARRPAVRPTAAQVARRPAVRPTAAQVARRPPMRPTAAPARAVTTASTNRKATTTTTPTPRGKDRRKGRRRKNKDGRRKNKGGRRKNKGGRRKNKGGRRKGRGRRRKNKDSQDDKKS